MTKPQHPDHYITFEDDSQSSEGAPSPQLESRSDVLETAAASAGIVTVSLSIPTTGGAVVVSSTSPVFQQTSTESTIQTFAELCNTVVGTQQQQQSQQQQAQQSQQHTSTQVDLRGDQVRLHRDGDLKVVRSQHANVREVSLTTLENSLCRLFRRLSRIFSEAYFTRQSVFSSISRININISTEALLRIFQETHFPRRFFIVECLSESGRRNFPHVFSERPRICSRWMYFAGKSVIVERG